MEWDAKEIRLMRGPGVNGKSFCGGTEAAYTRKVKDQACSSFPVD